MEKVSHASSVTTNFKAKTFSQIVGNVFKVVFLSRKFTPDTIQIQTFGDKIAYIGRTFSEGVVVNVVVDGKDRDRG